MKAYLPNDFWYELDWVSGGFTKVNKTGNVILPDNKNGIPPLHFRGGSIIPISSAINENINTSESIRKGSLRLVAFPGTHKTASGNLFWDDGESIDTIENNKYNYYSFNLTNCSLDIKVIESGYSTDQTLTEISIPSTNNDKIEATLDGKPIQSVVHKGWIALNFKLNLNTKKKGEKWTFKWKSTQSNSCNIV